MKLYFLVVMGMFGEGGDSRWEERGYGPFVSQPHGLAMEHRNAGRTVSTYSVMGEPA
jgi:hypothetical protein